jgi:hypothetical protein
MKTIGSSEAWYLPTIYTVINKRNNETVIDQPAFYSKIILHLPKLRSTNGNDPEGDLDLFQEIIIRLDGTENPRKHRQDNRQPGQNSTVQAWSIHTTQSNLCTHNNTRQSVFPSTLKTDTEDCSESWYTASCSRDRNFNPKP